VTDSLGSCAAFTEAERAALTADCEKLWDDVKCACLGGGSSAQQETTSAAPAVRDYRSHLIISFSFSFTFGFSWYDYDAPAVRDFELN
jgi:hypothetical protein